jgi:DNA repair exonuclease SbcCD ATPase subunit
MDDPSRQPLVLRVEISAEQVEALAPSLGLAGVAEAARYAELERERSALAEREAELEDRARRLREQEAKLAEPPRLRLVDTPDHGVVEVLAAREDALVHREAEFEADVLLREDRMEQLRHELDEREQQLERRARDLQSYAAQLQGSLVRASGSR